MESEFICPHNIDHDLTDYHLIQQIRYGVYDKKLQQELLQNHASLNTLEMIVVHCEAFDSAKVDSLKLAESPAIAAVSATAIPTEHSDDEMVAAISAYKRAKNTKKNNRVQKKCYC